jgi:hypothetical protein
MHVIRKHHHHQILELVKTRSEIMVKEIEGSTGAYHISQKLNPSRPVSMTNCGIATELPNEQSKFIHLADASKSNPLASID